MPIGYFYKWEDNNHGLEHKCGTCKTVLSSPRAKKTCFGIHEEVCTRYHKTLFFLGQSHHCDACHKTDQLHDKRHREIITLIKCIGNEDGLIHGASPVFHRRKKAKRPTFSLNSNADMGPDRDEEFEEFLEGWDNSCTLDEDKIFRRRESDQTNTPDIRKAAKSGKRTVKHQSEVQVITKEDLQELNNAIHPHLVPLGGQSGQDASQGLAHNAIEKTIAFNTNTFKYYSLRTNVHNKKVIKSNRRQHGKEPRHTPEQKNALIDPILRRLGIDPNLNRAHRSRRTLYERLQDAIYNDIVALSNEQKETMQRMAGYWRYASRRTYNAMVRQNEIWDWATGEKLPEINEESELSIFAESDSDGIQADLTDVSTSDDGSPRSELESYDSDFDLSEDMTTLNLEKASEGTISGEPMDGAKTPTQESVLPDEATCVVSLERNHQSLLTYSPGRSPGPTLTFSVPSPSSNDEFWDGAGVNLEVDEAKTILARSPNRQLFFKTSSMWAGDAKFTQEKDIRFKVEADRLASPTKTDVSVTENKKSTYPKANLSASPTTFKEILVAKDLNNRFKGLKIETAAPNEEIELEGPKTACFMPTEQRSFSSSSKDDVDQTDFPALPTIQKSTEEAATPAATSKTKVFSIGAAAVKLNEAKSRSGRQKRIPKGAQASATPMTSVKGGSTAEEAWTTVRNRKRH